MDYSALDVAATTARRQYELFQQALIASLTQIMMKNTPFLSSSRYDLASSSMMALDSFLMFFNVYVHDRVKDVSEAAAGELNVRTDAPAFGKLRSLLQPASEDLVNTLMGLGRKDIATIAQKHYQLGLHVELTAPAHRSRELALARKRILSSIDFTMPDRANRRWRSSTMVEFSVRHTLLLAYIEGYLYLAKEQGHNVFEVYYPEASPDTKPQIKFSLLPDDGLPGYLDIREEVFHPNTSAHVRAVE